MATIIELNQKEKLQLCALLEELETKVLGPLKHSVKQARVIYCNVKSKLHQVTITGDNITKLSGLLMAAAAIKGFEQKAEQMNDLIEKKKAQDGKD